MMSSPRETTRRLRITPRAATLTITTDPALADGYRVSWQGAAPSVRERGELVEVGYTLGARLRALAPRLWTLTVALSPAARWEITVAGGARDIAITLPAPGGELPVRVHGGLSGGVLRRPGDVPVSVQIDGGATDLRLDDDELGAVGGVVRRRTGGAGAGEITLHVLGGASRLTVEPDPVRS
jgi:hypothetical protein